MKAAHLWLAGQLIAFWPVWRWYGSRLSDGSDEPFGLLALATALLFVVLHGKPQMPTARQLVVSSAFLVVYLASWPWVPPLVRAIVAVLTVSYTLSRTYLGRCLCPGVLGLLVLSLPVMASLQFFAGYPARVITAHAAAPLIQLTGFPVLAQGTNLAWLGEIVAVDAPCAGLRMVWTGMYLSSALACFMRLGPGATWLGYGLALVAILGGNIVRAALLFYGEAGIVTFAGWMHSGIGLVVFAFVAVSIAILSRLLQRRMPCIA